MNRIIKLAAIALAFIATSCSFVKINGKALKDISFTFDSSADSGEFVTKDFEVASFTNLTCNIPCDLIYTPGELSVSVRAKSGIMERVKVETVGDELRISFVDRSVRNVRDLDVTVSCPSLTGVSLNGAVDFNAERGIGDRSKDFAAEINGAADVEIGALSAKDVSIKVNGAADIEVDGLDSDNLTLVVNGAGDAEIKGRTGVADITVNGVAVVDVKELKAACINKR